MFIIRFVWFLSRLFMAIVPKLFGQRDLVLSHTIGWDGIHPWAPYSWDGCPKTVFMDFYRRRKAGEKIDGHEYVLAKYGFKNSEEIGSKPNAFYRAHARRSDVVKRWFARTMNWDDVFSPRL